MKHALIVAFHYPPDGSSSGVLRTLKYTRYLEESGWRVTVLSPSTKAYESLDDELSAQIPPTAHIVRTRFLNSKRHFGILGRYPALLAVPDSWIGWLPFAVRAGDRIGRTDPFDIVYSTSPPASAHLVAGVLAARLKLPWVADFRDPWIEEPPEPGAPSGRLFRAIDKYFERRVIARCSHVVTTTDDLRSELIRRHSEAPDRFTTIPNGYDESDFPAPSSLPARKGEYLTLLHAGSINPHFRDPAPLLQAIRAAHAKGWLDAERIRLRFLGGGPYADSAELKRAVAEAGLVDSVEFVPRLSYAEALAAAAHADVLLLLQASDDTRGLVPAKLYEYLRMQKTVLALVLPGAASKVLEQTGGGVAVDPADLLRLSTQLADLYRRWEHGTLGERRADLGVLSRYERRKLTRELATIFERLVGSASQTV